MYGRYTTTHVNRRRVVQKKNQTLTKYVSKARSWTGPGEDRQSRPSLLRQILWTDVGGTSDVGPFGASCKDNILWFIEHQQNRGGDPTIQISLRY